MIAANERAERFYRHHGWHPDADTSVFDAGGTDVPERRYRRRLVHGLKSRRARGDPAPIPGR